MTNCNYTLISDIDIVSIINDICVSKRQLTHKYLQNNYPSLYLEVISRTKFLDDSVNGFYKITLSERLYCLMNGIKSHPICSNPNCNHIVKWEKRKFKQYCCIAHAIQDPGYKLKREQKCLEKHGVKSPTQLKSVQEKMQQTMLKHHGVKHALQSKTILDKFKRSFRNRTEQQKEQTRKKRVKTCNIKYGTDAPTQSEEVKSKTIQTCRNKYNCDYSFQSKEVKLKIRKSMIEHHGVENPSQSKQIRDKVINTMIERHGVMWYPQSKEYHQKAHKKYTNPKYPDMTFGSSWEFNVYDFLMENHIEFEYQPSISFEYEYDGKIHTYHPDFKVGNRIYEVKGDMFFRVNESNGKEEMFCPYRYNYWSDERYVYECGRYEAKYQCMLKNNVVIFREEDINILQISMFDV